MKGASPKNSQRPLFCLFLSVLAYLEEGKGLLPSDIYDVLTSLQSNLASEANMCFPQITLESFAALLNEGMEKRHVQYRDGSVFLCEGSRALAGDILDNLRFQIRENIASKGGAKRALEIESQFWDFGERSSAPAGKKIGKGHFRQK